MATRLERARAGGVLSEARMIAEYERALVAVEAAASGTSWGCDCPFCRVPIPSVQYRHGDLPSP